MTELDWRMTRNVSWMLRHLPDPLPPLKQLQWTCAHCEHYGISFFQEGRRIVREISERLEREPPPDAEELRRLLVFAAPVLYRPSGYFEPSREETDILRDVFGNPFRPVTWDPGWRTSDAVALARGIYQDRAFDRMPILADALQDAGCDDEQVLIHCRDPEQVHVRGCWVVDLVLGKS